MIRINLLKNFDAASGVQTVGGISYGEVKEENKALAIVKILVIAVFPFLVDHYEGTVLEEKFRKVQSVSSELNKVEGEVRKMGAAVEIVSRFENEKKQLESRVEVIRELSKHRLREVMALEKVQEMVPERAWLSEFLLEEGSMTLRGTAVTNTEISNFTKTMEESGLFSNVIFTSSADELSGGKSWQSFEITCQVESL